MCSVSAQIVQTHCTPYRYMKTLPVRYSGRSGEWVYYVRGNKQCRRRYVRPKDPRTPAQLRVRAAFGAASRFWSHADLLSDQDRDTWEAAALPPMSGAAPMWFPGG